MLALIGLVGNLGGGAVVVHRLGRRHIGVGPFETKGNGGQIEGIKQDSAKIKPT